MLQVAEVVRARARARETICYDMITICVTGFTGPDAASRELPPARDAIDLAANTER